MHCGGGAVALLKSLVSSDKIFKKEIASEERFLVTEETTLTLEWENLGRRSLVLI